MHYMQLQAQDIYIAGMLTVCDRPAPGRLPAMAFHVCHADMLIRKLPDEQNTNKSEYDVADTIHAWTAPQLYGASPKPWVLYRPAPVQHPTPPKAIRALCSQVDTSEDAAVRS
jgi:hypothetical protein